MIAYRCFTPILKIFHPQDDSFTPILVISHPLGSAYWREGEDSWHPHPTYPPLITLKTVLFAFTRTLRGIDPYWIPIFTEGAQDSCIEIHPICLNFTQFLITMNDTYKDFVTIHIFCFKSQDRRRPKADSEGGIDRWIDGQSLADRSVWSSCP